jgi:hypothetical protein
LIGLAAKVIRCVDLDPAKSEAVANALGALGSDTLIETTTDAAMAAAGADGIINGTPLGMVGIGGTPLPFEAMHSASWAFDAVYTPVDTQFLQDANRAGLTVISGYGRGTPQCSARQLSPSEQMIKLCHAQRGRVQEITCRATRRTDEPHDQEGDGEAIPRRSIAHAPHQLQGCPQLRPKAEDHQRPHAL